MLTPKLPAFLSCLTLLTALAACDADGEDELVEPRSVLFDGEEVEATLAADPDAVFFVDLRDDTIYGFDQRVRPLDWDHFMVQCPSMPAPMPMPDFVRTLGLDNEVPFWSLASAWDRQGFRALGTFEQSPEDLDCSGPFCDENNQDCVYVCSN